MGIFKSAYTKLHNSLYTKSSVYADTPGWSNYSGGSNNYTNDEQELSAYEKIVWFSSCGDVIAQDTTSTGYHFEKTGTDQILEESRINEAITRPINAGFNKLSFLQMLELNILHKKLTGNGYLFKAQTTAYGAVRGVADQFYPLNPSWVTPKLTQNGMGLVGYEVRFEDGTVFNIPPDRIIHFIQNPVFNPNVGVGNVTKARLIAENETISDEYVNEFMLNKASPSLAITENTERDSDDIDRLTDMLAKKYEKKKNAGKIIYMAGDGVQIQSLNLSQKDMQFLEGKVFNRQAILSVNKTPGVRIAIPEGFNKAIAQVMLIMYFDKTINPEIQSMEEAINEQFIHPIDPNVSIKFKRHHVGDVDQITKMISSGVITPNRGSQILGEEVTDSEERNNYYVANNLIPINLAGEQLKAFAGGEEKKKPTLPQNKKIDLHNPKNVDAILANFEKSATRTKKFQLKYLRQSLNDRNAVEDKYAPELAAFFKRSLDRILANISENENRLKLSEWDKKELVENDILLIYNVNADNTDLADTAKRLHTSGVQRSVAGLNATMNESVNFSISNPFIKNAIGRLGKQIKRVSDTTKADVERILLKEIESGGNVVTLTKKLQEEFTDFQGYRARRIARTEARLAWDAGAEVMYKEVGVKRVDIVGCTEFEKDSDCGKQDVSINLLSTLDFHPNHVGAPAPSEEPN